MDNNIEEIKVETVPVSSNYMYNEYKNNNIATDKICEYLEKEYIEREEFEKKLDINHLHILTNLLKSNIKDDFISIEYLDGMVINPELDNINKTKAMPYCIEIKNKNTNKTYRLVYSETYRDTLDIWYYNEESKEWDTFLERRIHKRNDSTHYETASISISEILSQWLASPNVPDDKKSSIFNYIDEIFIKYIYNIITTADNYIDMFETSPEDYPDIFKEE